MACAPAIGAAPREDALSAWPSPSTPGAAHDRAFWRAIASGDYAVPAGASADALAEELSRLLGSPDAELRDTLAYTILAVWIERGVLRPPQLLALTDRWVAGVKAGGDAKDGPPALLRSFSALCLAAVAERDRAAPFLDEPTYRALLDAALAYVVEERDLRGYDQAHGWVHATAHTADLLRELARNRRFSPADQSRLLAAAAGRLASAPEVFTQGEQDRLAQAVAALVLRGDFDAAAFADWLTGVRGAIRQSWRTAPLTPAALATAQNQTYFLQALFVRLSMETLDGPPAAARAAVLAALRRR